MNILEQEEKPGVVPRLEVESQLSSETDLQKYQVVFGPELTAAIIFRLTGTKNKVISPDKVTKETKTEERELVGIDPGTTFRLLLESDSVELSTQHLIYRGSEGKRKSLNLRTDNFDTDEERRKAQRPEMARLLDLFATVMEENFEPGKTDQAELTVKGLRRLAEILKQEDLRGSYLFEFLKVQRKAPISAADVGG